jgi:pentatricopeptide repeat protein
MGSQEYSAADSKNDELRGTVEELDDFCRDGKLEEAIKVMKLMEQQRVNIDLPRFVVLMKACGENKSIEDAKYVHEQLSRSLPATEVSTNNKVLQMYWDCGSSADAYKVFDTMPQKNLTSWDTMITGLAKNGFGEEAIDMFTNFKNSGLVPDGQSFLGIFSACSAVYDISEGLLHFESMKKDYNIEPSMDHYVSIVHMLGSTGYIDEAMEFIENMPILPNADIYETLMNLSRVHGNTELGDRCAEFVELLDPTRLTNESRSGLIPVNPADFARVKKKKNQSGANLLGVRSEVHEYRAGDKSHPNSDKQYVLLEGLRQQMKELGYIPEVKFVLHDIDQESKEEALMAHSERLAVAQGLLTSPARADMRVIKNLRVCGDCHNAFKIISKIVGRTLVMRDAKRFHHLKDGACSCNDYW